MSKRNDDELIQDIFESINRITAYTGNINYEHFKSDPKTQDAVFETLKLWAKP